MSRPDIKRPLPESDPPSIADFWPAFEDIQGGTPATCSLSEAQILGRVSHDSRADLGGLHRKWGLSKVQVNFHGPDGTFLNSRAPKFVTFYVVQKCQSESHSSKYYSRAGSYRETIFVFADVLPRPTYFHFPKNSGRGI